MSHRRVWVALDSGAGLTVTPESKECGRWQFVS
jgi:hypothetical protein